MYFLKHVVRLNHKFTVDFLLTLAIANPQSLAVNVLIGVLKYYISPRFARQESKYGIGTGCPMVLIWECMIACERLW